VVVEGSAYGDVGGLEEEKRDTVVYKRRFGEYKTTERAFHSSRHPTRITGKTETILTTDDVVEEWCHGHGPNKGAISQTRVSKGEKLRRNLLDHTIRIQDLFTVTGYW
jgi:hypothetical protein